MANDITAFEQAAVPAFLQSANTGNDDLTQHASTSYPIMSIKGKVFAVVRDGVRMVVPNPKDPESPAHSVEVALIKVNPNTSKVFYMQAFKEGDENIKPTCFSSDGKHPDPQAQQPQCSCCANCPHNKFGTSRNPDGSFGKGKACSDSVRIALADLTNIHEPMMLRVPPASIKSIGEYGRILARRKVPYQAVVTRISFVASEATPRLQFAPAGYVTEEMYREILEEAKSDTVRAILTGSAQATQETQTAQAAEEMEIPNRVYGANGQVSNAPRASFTTEAPAPSRTPAESMEDAVNKVVTGTVQAYEETHAAPVQTKTVSDPNKLADELANLGFDD